MYRLSFILSIIIALTVGTKAFSIPFYTDEIPQTYINKVNSQQKLNPLQSLPIYNKDNAVEVKIYSPKNIDMKVQPRKESFYFIYDVTFPKINEELTFLVAQDVYKNGKIFIKKETPAIGVVREAVMSMKNYGTPSEIQVSMFKTKDINNNTIELYGIVGEEKSGILSIPAAIKKNKIYYLYCK